MSLAFLRRPRTAADAPPEWLATAGMWPRDWDTGDARLFRRDLRGEHWSGPTADGRGVWHAEWSAVDGAVGGSGTTLAALDHLGATVRRGLRGARWHHVLLVADGHTHVTTGDLTDAVTDNLAAFVLPDRARRVTLLGPTGSRPLDLGPSDWDRFPEAAPGG